MKSFRSGGRGSYILLESIKDIVFNDCTYIIRVYFKVYSFVKPELAFETIGIYKTAHLATV